jgi:hypothetical protein
MTDIDASFTNVNDLIKRLHQTPHAPGCPGRFPDVAYNCQCQYRFANEAAAALKQQWDEIAALCSTYDRDNQKLADRAEKAEAERDRISELHAESQHEIDKLRAERDELKADAERYLWLGEQVAFGLWGIVQGNEDDLQADGRYLDDKVDIDAAIDAAMKEGK